jgi:hypothetical protein
MDIDDEYEETIGFVKFGTCSNEHTEWNRALALDLKRIAITPEWLERCGFKWDNGYLKISLKYAKMELGFYAGLSDKMSLFQTGVPGEGGLITEIGFGENHPEHLHQLQNLYFSFTGEALPIEIPMKNG